MSIDNSSYGTSQTNYPLQGSLKNHSQDAPLSVGDYMLMMFLASIPIVNLAAILYWALSGSVNRNKKSFALACIVWGAIAMVIGFILFHLFVPALLESMETYM